MSNNLSFETNLTQLFNLGQLVVDKKAKVRDRIALIICLQKVIHRINKVLVKTEDINSSVNEFTTMREIIISELGQKCNTENWQHYLIRAVLRIKNGNKKKSQIRVNNWLTVLDYLKNQKIKIKDTEAFFEENGNLKGVFQLAENELSRKGRILNKIYFFKKNCLILSVK